MGWNLHLLSTIIVIILGISVIKAKVELTHSPDVVFENTSLSLTCRYNGTQGVYLYTWKRNSGGIGQLQYDSTTKKCSEFIALNATLFEYSCPDMNSNTLKILKVTQSNNDDVWQCSISLVNGSDEESNLYSIIVQVPVTSVEIIEPASTPVTVKENTVQTFRCRTSKSRPTPTIQWFLDDGTEAQDRIITDNVHQTPSANENVLETTTGTLPYKPTRQVNGWQLYCSAQNMTSSRKSLNITYPPNSTRIDRYPNNSYYYVIAGKQQTLTCESIDGNPAATLQWSCFTGSNIDRTIGTTVTSQRRWTTQIAEKCVCESVHMNGNQRHSLNVELLNAVNDVKFRITNTEVSGTVRVVQDSATPIVCSASGTPTITYRWTHGTMDVTGERLLSTDILQDGTYTCSAYNTLIPTQGQQEHHNSTSSVDIIRLYLSTPEIRYGDVNGPVITEPLRVVRGHTFTLRCHAASSQESSYSWNRGNTKGPLLTISSLNDDAHLICTAITTMGPTVGAITTPTTFSNMSVVVLKPPTIPVVVYHHSSTINMTITDSIRVFQGNSFNISCSSTGKPAPSVSWTNMISSNTKTFLSVTKDKDGMYSCMAQNSMNTSFDGVVPGTSLKNISIHVLYEPVVRPLTNITIVEGNTPNTPVECQVTPGKPPQTTIKWTKDNKPVASENGVTSLQLPLRNVNRSEDGTYDCTAENTMDLSTGQKVGKDSKQFQLVVFYDTSILKFEELNHPNATVVTVMESDKIQLNCSVDSKPWSTISITNGQMVNRTEPRTNNFLYTIMKTTCLDTGNYTCVGFNEKTDQVTRPSKNLQLYVKCGPRLSPINATELNQTSTLNTTTPLQVYILAYPAPTQTQLTWKKRTGDTFTVVNDARMEHQISTSGIFTRASLQIHDVQRSDFGEYQLHVEHDITNANFTLFFKPKDKPSPPTNTGYTKVTVTSAVIYWTPGFDGGLVQAFIIMYRKDGESQWSQEVVVDTNQNQMNITLENLEGGSSYTVRIDATNELGNSSAQSDLYFKTVTVLSPGTPAALIGGSVAGSVVVIAVPGVLVILFLRRKQIFKGKNASDVELSKRPVAESDDDDDDDDDGMKPNPMYETSAAVGGAAGGSAGGAAGHNDVYATPIKKGKLAAGPQNSDIYAQVQKKNKTAKKKEKKGKSNGNNKGGQMGDVYENVQPITGQKASTNDNTYENPVIHGKSEEPKKKNVNKDGLIYADLAFNDKQKGQKKLVIIGSDDRTPYAQVDFTKKADPLPDSDDEK